MIFININKILNSILQRHSIFLFIDKVKKVKKQKGLKIKMQKKVLLKGAIIVLSASIVTRILGFFFRVFLADNLGAQGMGIYQLILSLYLLVVTFATSGISFAVSCVISENMAKKDKKNPKTILKISMLWAFFLGLFVCLIMMLFKDQIAINILREKRTTLSIFWLAPSLPFMAVSSCIKGYFFAKRKPSFPSIASIIEQGIRMIFIFLLLGSFLEQGINVSCSIISIGMTISEIISFFFMLFLYSREKEIPDTYEESKKNIFKNILKVSVPIQTSTSFNAALKLIESILIIESLKIFTKGNIAQATGTYGIIRGMVLPLILFPTSFLQSIITVLIPELSGATAGGNKKAIRKACEKSLQLTLIMGIFVAAIFIMFPDKIATMFYKNEEVAPLLKIFSLLCPILYVQLICMGILNSIGEQIASMKYNIIEGVLKIILIALFVPKGGINAFLILTFLVTIFSLFLFALRLVKVTAFPILLNKILIKPIIAIVFSCFLSLFFRGKLEKILPNWIFIGMVSGFILIVYFIFLFCFGCLQKPEKSIIRTNANRKQI